MVSASEATHSGLTADQRAKERSVAFAIAMDTVMVAALFLAGLLGGSLTMLAEALRGGLGYLMECFTFVVLRRVHRGVLADMEYGSGKLEQVANFMIGVSMLMASAWIGFGVLRIISGQRQLGTPMGLAFAAIVGSVNAWVNLMARDAVRRAASGGASLIMQAQLTLRRVKLVASLVVGVGLTIAAVSTDDVVVAWADALGSLFVAGYLVVHAAGVLRSAIPDLLDRSAGKDVQQIVARALAAHSADYDRVHGFRSRRSGRTTFIEIVLGFDVTLTMSAVHARIEAMKATIQHELHDAQILIVADRA
jgi:cation diffusion facilitator family transporter